MLCDLFKGTYNSDSCAEASPGACTPSCEGKQCGDNGCGGSCGECGASQTCNTGQCVGGQPMSLEAQAVGAYTQVTSNCRSGSVLSGYAMFLCPGGRIRGAGHVGNATELMCGSYYATAPSMQDCTDMVGCYPKVHATVRDTLILDGQQDIDPSFQFEMLMPLNSEESFVPQNSLARWTDCTDPDQEDGSILLKRIAVDVDDDYCVSDACPASTGGGAGTCGTDCDCGHCWYCEESGGTGTCRYGGEGPNGCYRGCG